MFDPNEKTQEQIEWEEFVERQRQDSLAGARRSGGLVSEEEVNQDYDRILEEETPETYN